MKYFLAFLAAVALIVAVFILVIRGFTGGGHPAVQVNMVDYAKTDTVVRMVESGRVNIDQEHRSISVVIGRNSNKIDLVGGYQGNVLNTKTYASNESAYATFLRALDLQGYTKGNTDPKKEDSRGFCPTGKVYTFQIMTGSDTVQNLWTSSCGGGTFKGNLSIVRTLFRQQIPDYTTIIRGTNLN
jgi:hypothetical protein